MHHDRDAPHGPPETLRVRARSLGAGRFLLTVAGELDHHSADRVLDQVRSALDRGAATVLLDLSDVSFLDSSGITRLLLAHRAVQATGGHLALIAPSEPVKRLLSITGVDQVLPGYPTLDAVPGPDRNHDSAGE